MTHTVSTESVRALLASSDYAFARTIRTRCVTLNMKNNAIPLNLLATLGAILGVSGQEHTRRLQIGPCQRTKSVLGLATDCSSQRSRLAQNVGCESRRRWRIHIVRPAISRVRNCTACTVQPELVSIHLSFNPEVNYTGEIKTSLQNCLQNCLQNWPVTRLIQGFSFYFLQISLHFAAFLCPSILQTCT